MVKSIKLLLLLTNFLAFVVLKKSVILEQVNDKDVTMFYY